MPNWKKLIVSGSDALLNSLNVSTDLTVSGSINVGSTPPSNAAIAVDGNIKGTGYLLLNDSNNQFIFANPSGRVVEIYASSSITSGDPAFRIRQDNAAKVDFGWDDEGTSEAFVWNYSNGGFKIGTNSTERFKITAGGNVGIGISNPSNILHVQSSDETVATFASTDNKAAIKIADDDTTGYVSAENGRIAIGPNVGTHVNNINILTSNSNVGIGTQTPTQPLHVAGIISGSDTYINGWNSVSASLSAHAQALVNNIDGSGTANFVPRFSDSDTLTNSIIQDDGSTVGIGTGPGSKTLTVSGDGQFTGELFFSHFDAIGTNASRFRDDVALRFGTAKKFGVQYNSAVDKLQFVSSSNSILNLDGDLNAEFTGNVGIGTTPHATYPLFINGGTTDQVLRLSSSDTTTMIGMVDDSSTAFYIAKSGTKAYLGFKAGSSNAENVYIMSGSGNLGVGTASPSSKLHVVGSNGTVRIDNSSSVKSYSLTTMDSNNRFRIQDNTAGAERFTITNGGNVGIGAGSPSEKLHVDGNIKATGNIILNDGRITSDGTTFAFDGAGGKEVLISSARDVRIVIDDNDDDTNNTFEIHKHSFSNANKLFSVDQSGNSTITGNLTTFGGLSVGDSNADTAQIGLKHLLGYCENTDVDTGTEDIKSLPLATYQAVFFDYVVKNGTNLRAGTVMAVHDGTNVEFTDTSTKSLGDTSGITLSVDISGTNMRLRATTTSDNWVVKANIRGIKV